MVGLTSDDCLNRKSQVLLGMEGVDLCLCRAKPHEVAWGLRLYGIGVREHSPLQAVGATRQ